MVKLSAIALLALAGAVHAAQCNSYACSKQNLSNNLCGVYNSTTYAYALQECSSSSQYCAQSGATEWTCQTLPSTKSLAYPGEYCKSSSDCYYGSNGLGCSSSKCVGLSANTTCSDSHQCQPGYYCSGITTTNGTCLAQASLGAACTSDYSCINTAFCNSTGYCQEYFTAATGSVLPTCADLVANRCSSGACATSGGVNYCIDAQNAKSPSSLPVSCSYASTCYSANFTLNNALYNITKECQCGYNAYGHSFCPLNPGDSIYQSFIKYSRKWYTSSDIKKCNTARRDIDQCKDSVWDSDDYEAFLLYDDYTNNYPQYQQNDDCVKKILTKSFYEEQDDVDDNDDSALWLASSAVLAALALN